MLEMKIAAPHSDMHIVSALGAVAGLPPRPALPLLLTEEHRGRIIEGLLQPQKRISGSYLHDEIGLEIFGAICNLPEYYPMRTELALLRHAAPAIAAELPKATGLIEFGPMTHLTSRPLLNVAPQISSYRPVDSCMEGLHRSATRVSGDFPDLPIVPLCHDFESAMRIHGGEGGSGSLGMASGILLSRYSPDEASDLLKNWRHALGPGSKLLVGVELEKDVPTLVRARKDSARLTDAYNLNLLARLNREMKANFNLMMFSHQAIWNPRSSSVAVQLVSHSAHFVEVAGVRLRFSAGETIQTQRCYAHGLPSFHVMARRAGWKPAISWVSEQPAYALVLYGATAE